MLLQHKHRKKFTFKSPRSSEMLVSYNITTRCHNPEGNDLKLHRLEILKSQRKVYLNQILKFFSGNQVLQI